MQNFKTYLKIKRLLKYMILQRCPAFLRIRIDPSQQNQVILYVRTSYFCASTKAYLRSIRDRMVISQIDAVTLLSRLNYTPRSLLTDNMTGQKANNHADSNNTSYYTYYKSTNKIMIIIKT